MPSPNPHRRKSCPDYGTRFLARSTGSHPMIYHQVSTIRFATVCSSHLHVLPAAAYRRDSDLRVALVHPDTGAIAWDAAHGGCKLTIRSGFQGAPQLTLEQANGGSIMQCILSARASGGGGNANAFDAKTDRASSDMYFHYYGQLQHQQNMLQDYTRTGTYYSAIVGNPADFAGRVVMDVGAGSGILSLFAAQVVVDAFDPGILVTDVASLALDFGSMPESDLLKVQLTPYVATTPSRRLLGLGFGWGRETSSGRARIGDMTVPHKRKP
eukprot:XP_001700597.1 predicted protein [Chlamydomonas reinhardtii]